MILKIFMFIVVILILLFLIIFLEPIHIDVMFKNDNIDYDGYVNIKYYFLFLKINPKKRALTILFKIKSHEIKLKTFDLDNDVDEEESSDDDESSISEEDLIEDIKEIASFIVDNPNDILSLIKQAINVFEFDKCHVNMELGLGDNNLTIKLCNILWSITAPLYTVGLQVILTPLMNVEKIRSNLNVQCNVVLLNLLYLIYKILRNNNLRHIIQSFSRD